MERPPLLNDLFRMSVKIILGGILIIFLFSIGAAVVGSAGGGDKKHMAKGEPAVLHGEAESENAILRIDLKGVILSHAPEEESNPFFADLMPIAYGYKIKQQLLDAAEDDAIKGVLLFVSTPGGSIAGSQAVFDGVEVVQAAGKPVIAFVDIFSASGGVYSTAGADKVFADHGSMIGSVGVNFGTAVFYDDPVALDRGLFSGGVETRGGVKTDFIGAGIGKDLGNPFRPMTERERSLLVASAEEFYDKFVDLVVDNRGIDRAALVNQHGAMIYANEMAEQFGYIDGTKTYQETLSYIAAEIGAEGDDWKLVAPARDPKSPLEELFGMRMSVTDLEAARTLQGQFACRELTAGPVLLAPRALADMCAG